MLLACAPDLVEPMGTVEVEVPYATTRERTGTSDPARFYGSRVGALESGVVRVRVPHDPRTGDRATGAPLQRSTLVEVSPRQETTSPGALVVFVHGFDVGFEGAARRAAQLAYDLDLEGQMAFFAWPSAGTYGGDEVRVLRAATPFREWLLTLVESQDTVHLIAHSMGARTVVTALRAMANEEAPPHFGEVVLVAPDIDADDFVDEIAPAIQSLAERITVYASANERALHHDLDAEALGDAEEGVSLGPEFETIDASAVDTSLLGHAYPGDRRSVVTDLAALFGRGSRDTRLEQRLGQQRYWTIEPPAR